MIFSILHSHSQMLRRVVFLLKDLCELLPVLEEVKEIFTMVLGSLFVNIVKLKCI